MQNYKIETGCGDNFHRVAAKAQEQSNNPMLKEVGRNAEFDFNGIICVVSPDTNLDNLYKYYADAYTMGWKLVGPTCKAEYPADIQEELDKRNKKKEEEMEAQRKVWAAEEKAKKQALKSKVGTATIELIDEALWNNQKEVNNDGYGKGILDYAENWALLMQYGISQGQAVKDIADKASHEADIEGITGFMHGAAVRILSHCWKHGEELRKWHNKEYNHEGDGVVNPAIITIKTT